MDARSELPWLVAVGGLGVLGVAFLLTREQPGPPATSGQADQQPRTPAGCVPILLQAVGAGTVTGCGGWTRSSVQVCPQPGDECLFEAVPDPGVSFLHWAGAGVTSMQNPLRIRASSPGFVTAYFSTPADGAVLEASHVAPAPVSSPDFGLTA